jgi:hypothetical protein
MKSAVPDAKNYRDEWLLSGNRCVKMAVVIEISHSDGSRSHGGGFSWRSKRPLTVAWQQKKATPN